MTWVMFTYRKENCFMIFGSEQFVKAHHLPEPIVRVELQENPEGNYYGWVVNGELIGAYVWPSYAQFSMCFPYGHKAEEERGEGKMVRLSVKETK